MATGRLPDPNTAPVTAKGDLYTYSTVPAKLAVGSNGDTLVADSAATTGLRWQGNYSAGKNTIINGDFKIWQRGTSFSGTNQLVYTADRWQLNDFGGQTSNVSQQTFTAGTAPVSGYEGQFFARWTRAAAGTATSYLTQKIEDVRTFANQTVTVSFWAKAAATETMGVYIDQNFGSGGSSTVGTSNTNFSITTSWTRFSVTLSLASISGKTIGTSSFLGLTFQVGTSEGAFTIDLWGIQLEAGSVATAFQTATGTLAGELAACQRYYTRLSVDSTYDFMAIGLYASTTQARSTHYLPVQMRVSPSSIDSGGAFAASDGALSLTATSPTFGTSMPNVVAIYWTVSGATQYRPIMLISDNNASTYLGFNAEL